MDLSDLPSYRPRHMVLGNPNNLTIKEPILILFEPILNCLEYKSLDGLSHRAKRFTYLSGQTHIIV